MINESCQRTPFRYKERMMAGAFESGIRLWQFFWFALVAIAAVFLGYLLASDLTSAVLASMALTWLMTLPYHSKLAAYLSVATFSSALILPFFPGRPFLWEFASLLGWSGLVVTISFRQFAPEAGQTFRRHAWFFVGLVGY